MILILISTRTNFPSNATKGGKLPAWQHYRLAPTEIGLFHFHTLHLLCDFPLQWHVVHNTSTYLPYPNLKQARRYDKPVYVLTEVWKTPKHATKINIKENAQAQNKRRAAGTTDARRTVNTWMIEWTWPITRDLDFEHVVCSVCRGTVWALNDNELNRNLSQIQIDIVSTSDIHAMNAIYQIKTVQRDLTLQPILVEQILATGQLHHKLDRVAWEIDWVPNQ